MIRARWGLLEGGGRLLSRMPARTLVQLGRFVVQVSADAVQRLCAWSSHLPLFRLLCVGCVMKR